MQQFLDISIVIPAYNEAESLPELCEWISKELTPTKYSYEVIIIDDGSSDETWKVIQELSGRDLNVKGLRFNRNYGKSAALNTGFNEAIGEVVVTMDADLQDSPAEVPELAKMIEDGADLVSGWKKKRHDPISKTIPSKFFNYVTRKLSGIRLHDFNCGLKAYRKDVVKNVHVYGEMHRYIPLLAKWEGYDRIEEKVVEHRARKYGVTKFGLERFIFGFLDLLSVLFVAKFKKRPMHFFGSWGLFYFVMGILITIWLIGQKVYFNWILHENVRQVTDQPLFFLALLAVVIGAQLFLAGFLAELITKTSGKKNDYLVSERSGGN